MVALPTPDFGLSEHDWRTLLDRINNKKCTPFIGAGACVPKLPGSGSIAKQWADENGYPFKKDHERENLIQVAQYLAIMHGGENVRPKEILLQDNFSALDYPDFAKRTEAHGILAELPIPLYITTNYDDFMTKALLAEGKEPQPVLCQWNASLRGKKTIFDNDDYEPDPQKPVVFHLHGHKDNIQSLVLTEEDYIDFLVQLSKGSSLIPPYIQGCLVDNTILFIGYSLKDINFRVLFRSILNTVEKGQLRFSFTLQFPESDYDADIKRYLGEYFKDLRIKVAWGSAEDFSLELHRRWKDYINGKP